jgi:hypothetical protein
MRKVPFALAALLALTVVAYHISAQDKPRNDSKTPATTLKVQVTFAENEGEKKLANLPYTFFLKTGDTSPALGPSWTKVRMGSRVPVYAGKDAGMQYIDIGTNIDARALPADAGRFDVFVNLERSWVEGEVQVELQKGSGGAVDPNAAGCKQPIIRQFKTELTLTMHDGETIQTTQAADPLSGRVLTITVTMNVVT